MSQKNRSLWITLYFITIFQCCFSNDIITQNQSFKDGDILVSSGNNFAFGFFRPGNSQNGYVGIWYNKISVQTVVWVANRDNPIINGSSHGVLSIENSGNLVLRDQTSNMPIWSTQVSGTSTGNSYFVQLLDTGNLVLCEGDQNTPTVLWESFHYPTDTLLPYMKQGMNRTSGLLWSLTSWKSQDDPGTGDCQLKVILNGTPQFYLYKNSERERVWRAGPWNGIQLSGVPDMPTSTTFNGSYVENSEEIGLLFGIRDPSVISKLTVNESGIVERLTWQEGLQSWVRYWVFPRDSCDYYSHCGSFSNCNPYKLGEFECQCLPGYEPKVESEWNQRDGINGCRRNPGEPTCGNISAQAAFIAITSAKVPDTSNAVVNKILELNECADLCLKNCSCTAYASANISNGGNGCITWYGDLIDMRQFPNTGQDVYIKVSASELAQYLKSLKGASNYRKKLMIILIPSTVGILFLVFAIWLALWKRKGQGHAVSSSTEEIDENGDLSLFDLKTIISVTNGFAYDNKLGEGGFGSVYKGQLDDGREVAIKRLSNNSGQGIEEFKNEVRLIAKLQHRNLVKLLGCCIQQEEKTLVYEYLPNKGLDNFIFDKEKGALLDWQKRLDIILGIARGVVYLHRDSRLKIIHRDLKASNVLLDAKMEPKISDFGLARIVNADQMEAKTHRVVGTYGYMSPEYAMQGLFSEKSDVFSYGVLLLEIISGKKNNSYFSDNTVNLIGYAWELWKNGKSLDIVDPSIAMGDSGNLGEIGRCIHTSLLCVQEYARDRPTMSEVLSMLSNETSIPLTYPKQPAFVIKKVNYKKDNISSSSSYLRAFMDYITITIVEPR